MYVFFVYSLGWFDNNLSSRNKCKTFTLVQFEFLSTVGKRNRPGNFIKYINSNEYLTKYLYELKFAYISFISLEFFLKIVFYCFYRLLAFIALVV